MSLLRLLPVAAIAAGAMTAPAHAAVTVGTSLPPAPTGAPVTCEAPASMCLALHTDAGVISDGYLVLADGIVTSWSTVTAGAEQIQLARVNPEGRGGPAGPSAWAPPAAGLRTLEARIPVEAGDELGLAFSGSLTAVGADPLAETLLAHGSDLTTAPLDLVPGRVLLSATIEPDADDDGFGDETQDHCPGPRSMPCPTIAVAGPPPGTAMPGATVTQSVTLANHGPGHTHPTTAVVVRGAEGVAATMDGAACAPPNPTERYRLACPVGRMAPGRQVTVTATSVRLRPSVTRVTVGLEVSNRTGLSAKDALGDHQPLALTTTVPKLEELRPRATVARRLQGGRLRVTLRCPAAGLQDCRVRTAARLAPGGRGPRALGTTVVTVPRSAARTVRVRVPRRIRALLRTRTRQVLVTATRTDVPWGPLRSAASARVAERRG